MKTYINPSRSEWDDLCKRPSLDIISMMDIVRPIVDDVAERGDEALYEYEKKFDKVKLSSLQVTNDEFVEAVKQVSVDMQTAIRQAYQQIERFHVAQQFTGVKVETAPGVFCEQQSVAISKVGLYIPGGSAPLFSSVLMSGVPARIAGCRQVVLCTPPRPDGTIHPLILFTAQLCGITSVYKVGGAQAIAAMSQGTETIPKVDKIFGPGNQYVMATKQLVALMGTAIDMPAGPSEVEVLADDSACIEFVAADLLSQAEHGADSQVMLITTSKRFAEAVAVEVDRQVAVLPRKKIAMKSLENSKIIVLDSMEDAIDFTNVYAPEHLIIATDNPMNIGRQIEHAGSVFLGHLSCESAGDYASGTNHTLPTMGYARSYGGLCLDSFVRKMTYQQITPQGIQSIGKTVEMMAEGEELEAHRRAMALRVVACRANDEKLQETEKLAASETSEHSDVNITSLVRPNVLKMEAYSCARDEYSGTGASVFLDANESPYNAPLNRYPDPQQKELKKHIARIKGVKPENLFLGNGSDEVIDLVFRVFCCPMKDNVVAIEPTYGMYSVCAAMNDVAYRKVLLNDDFSFSASKMLAAADEHTKVMFLCSPNNPTGNLLPRNEILQLLHKFKGVVVVDEAYGDFAPDASVSNLVADYPQLIVLKTFSKAWASAGIRLGMAITSPEVLGYLNKVKYPYNVNVLTQSQALKMLSNQHDIEQWIAVTLAERRRMSVALSALSVCKRVYPSDANFILVKVTDAPYIYDELARRGIIVRNRTKVTLCNDCLRITVGTVAENNQLLAAMKDFCK